MTSARTLFLMGNGPVTSIEEAAQSFLTCKTAAKAAPKTCKEYAKTIRQFFAAFPQAWSSPLKMRTAFLSWLSQEVAPATYNLRLIYVRAFWRWCVDEGIQQPEPDPFRGLKRRSAPGRFCDIDAAKVKELLALPDRSTWAGLRDYALILFTLDTAARPGEALQLLPADFNFSSLAVVIPAHAAKTREERIIPLSPTTAAALRHVIQRRPREWDAEMYVFASVTGRRFAVERWNDRLKGYRLKDGTTFKPYDLRHAACTLHLRAGMSGEVLQRLMGHHGPQMTQRYIHLTADDLRKEQSFSSPVELLASARKRAPRRIK